MCEWESALDSTYNFNGALVAFRSDRISRINDKLGADDANTAFEAIRKGYRAVYEKKAIVYEDIPQSFKIQYRQKTRRATGLIEATLSNLDLLGKDTPFSRFFLSAPDFHVCRFTNHFPYLCCVVLSLAHPVESSLSHFVHRFRCSTRDKLETKSGLRFYPEPVLPHCGFTESRKRYACMGDGDI